jgi:hypothetical protein
MGLSVDPDDVVVRELDVYLCKPNLGEGVQVNHCHLAVTLLR